MTDAPTWGDLVAEHTPRTDSVTVCMRGDLVTQITDLEQQLLVARFEDERTNGAKQAPVIARQIVDLQAEAARYDREFTFVNIGKTAWSELLADHPATPEQKAEDRTLDHNPETFPYAAVARCCTSVAGGTTADVVALADKLSAGDWNRIWNCCLGVNLGASTLPKCEGATALLQRSEPSSTTAPPEGSPAASS